ncbi:thiamine biosynthesis protein ThiS [Candidatus Woesearchaeota archaeon CG_4_10_14_0_2_um_filter_57_5]|nr:MAG: hypothetical protein AUJ68_04210 [Candidatus Woesearchaeota archaeon CG1_02_57_44]PIN68071.1 MAG: thiamine biosynthesis protein ThiS [Candidatus Woesearchaeota archaeon CG11_big_fil_rev_8_21_14_0_20_57_5]PIZ55469.1 MAG: thiamine biosynthesis protein ThiS [Candidatus Woesearchaeota archaeon CG_4_10_14_0_2_um_filter_57_5]
MEARIEQTGERKEFSFSGSVAAMLNVLGVTASTVLVVRNGELLTSDDPVGDDDTVDVLSVVSGG